MSNAASPGCEKWKFNDYQILLDLSAPVNAVDEYSRTVLHYAAMNEYDMSMPLIVNEASDKEALINMTDADDRTALHYAAELESAANVIYLVNRGADHNLQDKHKLYAVDIAIVSGRIETVKFLQHNWQCGTENPQQKAWSTLTRIAKAEREMRRRSDEESKLRKNDNGRVDSMTLLLAITPEIELAKKPEGLIDSAVPEYNGRTPLLQALFDNNVPMADLLVDCGANEFLLFEQAPRLDDETTIRIKKVFFQQPCSATAS